MKETKTPNNLIDVRSESLKSLQSSQLRAHGKLWGLDVFSWQNPTVELLASTIHSFPFHVNLIGNTSLLFELLTHDKTVSTNLNMLLCYQNEHKIAIESNTSHVSFFESNDVQELFKKVYEIRSTKAIVLFCSDGIDSEYLQNAFNNYLSIHQINAVK
ncbi:MAG TPA: hypothetical protein VKZ44_03275 [Taishania sp.]|nr:hypothetical protein [Taishania sp.]